MKSEILLFSVLLFSLIAVNSVYAALTVSVSLPTKSLTENEQVTTTVTVSNSAGSSTESTINTELSSSTAWFSVVTSCNTISSLSGGQSGTSTCIIKPTSTGSDFTLTVTSTSQGGTSGSGSTSGINAASQSSSLTASISAASSVDTSATFYVGVTVTAPSANNVVNARATISESGQCAVDTSYLATQQNLGDITKGTSKSATNWKLTSSSASGTCSITVNVVSDVGGSASPSKSITVGTTSTSSSGAGTSGGGGAGGGGTVAAKAKVLVGEKDAIITIPSISAKAESNFSINSPVLVITGMKVKVVNAVTNVQITATKLDARPREVVSDAPGVVNQYLNIDKVNISAADIEKVTINFKVEKGWMAANSINESTISLYRYFNDQWSKLETTKVTENETNVYYQAVSPGLSVFAIAGEGKAIPAEKGVPTEKKPEGKKPAEQFVENIKRVWQIGVIVVGVAGAIVVVYLFKIKSHSGVSRRRK